jgi:NAD(P)-dependent dehydrogenase (short-subunit alcohol dehydrogenase family)
MGINNAGIGIIGPVEYLPLSDLRYQFEVNVFGQIAVTRAFLPLLRRANGRIINIGSVGDRITIPFGGALCASKSALASLNDALRLELSAWGIKVCLIEPAAIFTPGVDKVKAESEKLIETLPKEGSRLYASMFRRFIQRFIEREKRGSSPDVVATVVLDALTASHPKTRYPVGKDSMFLTALAKWMPDKVLD